MHISEARPIFVKPDGLQAKYGQIRARLEPVTSMPISTLLVTSHNDLITLLLQFTGLSWVELEIYLKK